MIRCPCCYQPMEGRDEYAPILANVMPSGRRGRMLAILMAKCGGYVRPNDIAEFVYPDRPEIADLRDIAANLRAILKPYGFTVESKIEGKEHLGYRLRKVRGAKP